MKVHTVKEEGMAECYVCCESTPHELLDNICLCKTMRIHRKCQTKINTTECGVCKSTYTNVRVTRQNHVSVGTLKLCGTWMWNTATVSVGIPYLLWYFNPELPVSSLLVAGVASLAMCVSLLRSIMHRYDVKLCYPREVRVYSLPATASSRDAAVAPTCITISTKLIASQNIEAAPHSLVEAHPGVDVP